MNATRSSSDSISEDSIPASSPQTIPKNIGYGHPEYNFVQGLMELQKSVVRMETILENVKQSSDETKGKVSKLEKTIYAAGVILAICIVVGGWTLNAAKDFAMTYFKASVEAQTKQPALPIPAVPKR